MAAASVTAKVLGIDSVEELEYVTLTQEGTKYVGEIDAKGSSFLGVLAVNTTEAPIRLTVLAGDGDLLGYKKEYYQNVTASAMFAIDTSSHTKKTKSRKVVVSAAATGLKVYAFVMPDGRNL